MLVRLTRKLAERIDGVDLASRSVGDVLEVPETDARLLIAEDWAVPCDAPDARRDSASRAPRARPDGAPPTRTD